MSIFGGKTSSRKEYHQALATILEQHEDGLLAVDEANKIILIICGEHFELLPMVFDAYEATVITGPIVSPEMAAAMASFKADGPHIIKAIKAVRAVSGEGLKESKDFVEDNCMEITGYPTWEEARRGITRS